MRDPLNVATAGRLRLACQIIHVAHEPLRTWVDLIVLEPCVHGQVRLPAGAPLALGFDCPLDSDVQAELEAVMTHWEDAGVVVQLDVVKTDPGFTYRFSYGAEHLAVSVG
jgi:hypothetical protein